MKTAVSSAIAATVLASTIAIATPAEATPAARPAWQSCGLASVAPTVNGAECLDDARRDLGSAVADTATDAVEGAARGGVEITGGLVAAFVRGALCGLWHVLDGVLRWMLPPGVEQWLDERCG